MSSNKFSIPTSTATHPTSASSTSHSHTPSLNQNSIYNNNTNNNNDSSHSKNILYPPTYNSTMHIHRSDSVTTLDVRIDKSDLNRLDLDSLLEIQSDPTTFILSTHIPLLYISKQMAFSSTEPSIETYFRWTPPNGACFPNMIQQLEYRHVNKLHHQQHLIPPIDIQTEKGKSPHCFVNCQVVFPHIMKNNVGLSLYSI